LKSIRGLASDYLFNLIKHWPRLKAVLIERDALLAAKEQPPEVESQPLQEQGQEWQTWVPPGHFYSPIPSIADIKTRANEIFHVVPTSIPGVALNEPKQLELLKALQEYYNSQPFTESKKDGLRYFFENSSYSYSDGIFLHCMIRHVQPKSIIEVGSGYSSCVMLDTNEVFFNNHISCTFIDPYPQLLESLIKPEDRERIKIIPRKLQEIDVDVFQSLSAGDILFIDSTHVSKVDSDVNYIFFKLLPSLQNGVYIHFHDIFYPFEYPKAWVYEGRAWNEDYLLRAFLQYNTAFEICFFNTFLEHFHEDKFKSDMPLCLKNRGGSIWLKKL